MNYNGFSEFYSTGMDLFRQGNHAGIVGNRVILI